MKIEDMGISPVIKHEVEDQSAVAEGDSTCDSDNGNFTPNKLRLPFDLADLDWTSDEDDEEGFEGWPAWSPASFKSNYKQNEGFKGLLQ